MNIVISKKHNSTNENTVIALYLYSASIVDVLRSVLFIAGIQSDYNDLIRNVVYIGVFILYFKYMVSNYKKITIITGLFILLLVFSIIINRDIAGFSTTLILLFFSRFIVAIIMFSSIHDFDLFSDQCHSWSWIAILYYFVYTVFSRVYITNYSYNMAFSYNMLLPAVLSLYYLIIRQKRRIYSIAIFFFSFIGILQFGSRGAIACIIASLLFMITYLFIDKKNGIIFISLIAIFALIVSLFSNEILNFLVQTFPNSRNLSMLRSNSFYELSNRDNYWKIALDSFTSSPFSFRGIAGDCECICDYLRINYSLSYYSHNFFIESLVSYGVLIGGGCIIAFGNRVIKVIYNCFKYKNANSLVFVFLIPYITFMMISGSIWQSYQHWIVFGILINRSVLGYKKMNAGNKEVVLS
ncbi:MAG: O-antigen ligase family protein [Pseudobutyrivibrio sp.]|nr:O-antigen ligase family protein [Pseudobutyrivibrio sp.]